MGATPSRSGIDSSKLQAAAAVCDRCTVPMHVAHQLSMFYLQDNVAGAAEIRSCWLAEEGAEVSAAARCKLGVEMLRASGAVQVSAGRQ